MPRSDKPPFVSVEEFSKVLDQLEIAWDDFVNNGTLSAQSPRDPILASWQRSKRNGVKVIMQTVPLKLHDIQLIAERERRRILMQTVNPILDDIIGTCPSNYGIAVTFSDEKGIILEGRYSNNRSYSFCEKIQYLPGADCSEYVVGTNGIGTSLECGKPVQVFAIEHFCSRWHDFACSSAPILDTVSGTTLGVLTITGERHLVEANNLNWVTREARVIQNNLQRRLEKEFPSVFDLLFQKSDQPGLIYDHSGKITRINLLAHNLFHANRGDNLEKVFDTQITESFFTYQFNKPFSIICRSTEERFIATTLPWNIGEHQVGGIAFFQIEQSGKNTAERETMSSGTRYAFSSIVGQSSALLKNIRLAEKASQFDSAILITGDTGTGKEVLAQAIHNNSPRKHHPFISINCGAMPKELIASELFGYEEGAFTGAQRGGRKGKFEAANGGTLFLDEIGDMPLEIQVYLLRVLEEGTITRIGSFKTVTVNVRVICATYKDLLWEVEQGRFRQDLFYRINCLEISLPPLAERKEDVPLLAEYFLRQQSKSIKFAAEALNLLSNYSWPGNIRELKNTIERAVILCDGDIVMASDIQLPKPKEVISSVRSPIMQRKPVQTLSRETVVDKLNECHGNVSLSAISLQISRSSLYRIMKKYGLTS